MSLIKALIISFLLILISFVSFQSANAEIKIAGSVGVETYSGRWASYVLHEAFARMKVPFSMPVYPLNRIELLVKDQDIDGETRVFEYGDSRPYLVRAGKLGMNFTFSFYTADESLVGQKIEDLQKKQIIIESLRGVKICEDFLKSYFPNYQVGSNTLTEQGLQKLLNKRLDLYCDIDLNVLNAFHAMKLTKEQAAKFRVYRTIKENIPLYVYLNKRHEQLGKRLEKTLEKMASDGTIEKLRVKVVKELNL